MADVFAWLFSSFLLMGLLGLLLYQLVSLSDLESDYINAYDLASRINKVVIPEFIVQASLCFLHFATGHWVIFLCCLPQLCYNFRMYTERRHLIDVTEIFSHLSWEVKLRIYKIVYMLFTLLVSIYCFIRSNIDLEISNQR